MVYTTSLAYVEVLTEGHFVKVTVSLVHVQLVEVVSIGFVPKLNQEAYHADL